MASVWMDTTGSAPVKKAGHLPPRAAFEKAAQIARDWIRVAPGRKAQHAVGFTYLLIEAGKVRGSVFVEAMSPPSTPEKGQPLRSKKSA